MTPNETGIAIAQSIARSERRERRKRFMTACAVIGSIIGVILAWWLL